jgi:hypothetical protein
MEIGPAALAEALDQACLGEQLQVAADTGLALAEDDCQVLDAQFAARKEKQDAQARRLGGCLERRDDVIAGK